MRTRTREEREGRREEEKKLFRYASGLRADLDRD
jgi:hypothetical protein